MSKQSKDYLDEEELSKLEFQYESAMEILNTHLEVLISNFEMQKGGIKSVEHFNKRLKKLDSAINKLKKKNISVDVYQLEQNLGDMVGIRLVCPFIDDVYDMVNLIKSSDLIQVYEEKDYIKSPKKSGYQSYHILVKIPVAVGDEIKMVKGEIQVRTLAMDAWAAMEHKIRYKPANSKALIPRQKEMLTICARAFQLIEDYMRNLLPKGKAFEKEEKKELESLKYFFPEEDLKQFEFEYESALKILKTHLGVRINNHNLSNGTKSVEHLNTRFKKMSSISRKLGEKNIEMNLENIRNNVSDVAAIRLVCPFINDVYDMVELIKSSDLIEVYEERDYIANPKESGYRSYHLLAYVPVPVDDDIKMVKTEIQIRTLAMDAWAAMEDRIMYNQNRVLTDEQKMMLKICANTFQEVEEYMSNLLNPNSKYISSALDEYFAPVGPQPSDEKKHTKK